MTRDEMANWLENEAVKHVYCPHSASYETEVCNKLRTIAAALRAPAVTGERDHRVDVAVAYAADAAASTAAGAPPALVALVQRWQKARLAVRDAEDHEAYSMAEQLLDIHERALLAWSPAPAPVAPPADWRNRAALLDSPLYTPAPPADVCHRCHAWITECRCPN